LTRARLDLGKWGEALALKKAKKLGYKCLVQNYRCPLGEIDLIAKDRDVLVFIEIKTRKGSSIDYSKEAVDWRKQRQLSKVALAYMKENNCVETKARFDVIAIHLNHGQEDVEVIQDAFELAYP
jgi:putative endonuclease